VCAGCRHLADIALLGLSVHGMVVDAAVLPRQPALRLLQIEGSAPSQALLGGMELCLPHLALVQVVEPSVLKGAMKLHVRPRLAAAFCALLGSRCSDASGHKQAVKCDSGRCLSLHVDPSAAYCALHQRLYPSALCKYATSLSSAFQGSGTQ
jgi:hypothetical protein